MFYYKSIAGGKKKLTTIYVYKVIFSCAKARDPSPFFVDNKAKRASYVCTYYNRGDKRVKGKPDIQSK